MAFGIARVGAVVNNSGACKNTLVSVSFKMLNQDQNKLHQLLIVPELHLHILLSLQLHAI